MKKPFLSALLACFLFINLYAQPNSSSFTYIGKFSALGVPEYLEPKNDVISQALLNDVKTSLPETKSVLLTHPEFIATTTQTDLILKAETDVWVTFVHENAGYTNALGYYSYDLSNPPKSTAEITKRTILFPNVSYTNSGGGLISGNKVKLGKFPANTGIGWFVIADAFKNGAVTNGNNIFYSESMFNPETNADVRAHNVLLKDDLNKRLILGFDDQRRDRGSDNDFNDVIFYITVSSFEAVKTDDVAVIVKGPDSPTTIPAVPPGTDTNTTGASTGNTNTTSAVPTTATSTTNTNTNNASTSNNISGANGPITIINNTTIVNNNGNGNSTGVGNNSNTGSGSNTATTASGSNTNSSGTSNSSMPTNPSTGTNENQSGGSGNTSSTTTPSGCTSCISNVTTCDVNITVCNKSGIIKADFEKIKIAINKQAVLSSKMTVLKQSVANKKTTTMQVVQLVKLFQVERYRLEAAQYLFPFTCDKSNFYQVNDVLLSSSVQQLNAFLKGKDMNDDNVTNVNTSVSSNCNVMPNQGAGNNQPAAGNNTGSCNGQAFSADEFFDLKNEINAQSFSDTRLTVMQQGIDGRCLTANQSAELVSLCSFDTDKIKVAKLLYDYTSDKNNYYKINKQFSFSSSVDELNKYIQTRK